MNYRILTLLSLLMLFTSPSARAAFIIDDFDDPLQMLLPEMENQSIVTPDVGVLNAERSIGVSSLRTDPIGMLDVAVTKSSQLSVRIDGQIPDTPQSNPLLSFSVGYLFDDPTDLTEGGVNEAVLIDMAVFQGSGVPSDLSIVVLDGNDVYAAIVSRFSLSSDLPYTIAIPFSSFGFRGGGGVGLADFSTIELFEVRFRLLQGGRDPDVKWFVQIDRIRVGRVVPEPGTWQFAVLTAAIIAINPLSPRIYG